MINRDMIIKNIFLNSKSFFARCKKVIKAQYKQYLLYFFGGSVFFVGLYAVIRPPITPLMVIRSVQNIFHRESPLWKRHRVPIEDIAPAAIYAVIAAEDNKFVDHFGFDIDALQSAIEYNISHKGSLLGGSTITQQTAKNVFLWPGRDIFRKGFEAYFTLLIESMRSKKRIMEVYLNVIEFGDGIYGIDAAAKYYFNTTAKKLTSYQSSVLAAILPNPRYYQTHLNTYLLQRRKNSISNGVIRIKNDRDNRIFIKSIE